MITVCCWLWNDGGRVYLPEHVNTLQRMVARHLPLPHRLVCITDERKGFAAGIDVMRTPAAAGELGKLRTPEDKHFPSCYRRLWMFSDAAREIGDRVLMIDVDLVVVRDLSPVFERREDFVGWRPYRDWGTQLRFGGGIYLLTPGTRTAVFDDFVAGPAQAIKTARKAGFRGSDQAWLSYKLGAIEPYFDRAAGIYSIRDFRLDQKRMPADARLVQLNGPTKPWSKEAQRLPWVVEHFR